MMIIEAVVDTGSGSVLVIVTATLPAELVGSAATTTTTTTTTTASTTTSSSSVSVQG